MRTTDPLASACSPLGVPAAPVVVGFDPAITAFGMADSAGRRYVCEPSGVLGDRRLTAIRADLIAFLDSTAPSVQLAIIEDLPVHGHGAGITGMVQGVVRTLLLDRGIPYATPTAATLKTFALGKGVGSKADMRMALYQRTGIDEPNTDAVDAWWLMALGRQYLGAPVLRMPATSLRALAKIKWPALTRP